METIDSRPRVDNASIHRSRYTRDYWAVDPRIDFFFLPPYSPELNPIELVFRFYVQEFLETNYFPDVPALIEGTLWRGDYYNDLRKDIYPKGGVLTV